MIDSEGYQQETAEKFIAVDIDGYKLLLGLPRLQKRNPTIEWHHNVWRHEQESTVDEVILNGFKNVFKSKEPAFVAFVQENLTTSGSDSGILAVRIHKNLDVYMKF